MSIRGRSRQEVIEFNTLANDVDKQDILAANASFENKRRDRQHRASFVRMQAHSCADSCADVDALALSHACADVDVRAHLHAFGTVEPP